MAVASLGGPHKADANYALGEYFHLIRWDQDIGESVCDVGCGDGDVTVDVLMPALPANFSRLCGMDTCEFQIMFADSHNKFHANQDYEVLDITIPELPPTYEQVFHHVFSFNCLHWVVNQEQAFKNIYNMLKPGGEALLMYMAQNPFYDIFKRLSKSEKWGVYMGDIHEYFPAYADATDHLDYINEFMESTRFPDFHCHVVDRTWAYDDLDKFKVIVDSSSPFDIPEERENEYIDDVVAEAQRSDAYPVMKYKIFIIFAQK